MSGVAFHGLAVGTGSWPETVIVCFGVSSGLLSCFSSAEWEEFRNKFLQNEFSEWFAGERESRGSGWVYLSGALKVQFELWLTLKTSVGKTEGFWFEKDYMTYYRYLFLKFHHCVGVIHDFSCFDLATVFGFENYQ